MDESEINASKFIVAGGDAAKVLFLAEEIFDLVAEPVKWLGMRDLDEAVAF